MDSGKGKTYIAAVPPTLRQMASGNGDEQARCSNFEVESHSGVVQKSSDPVSALSGSSEKLQRTARVGKREELLACGNRNGTKEGREGRARIEVAVH